MKGDDGRPAWAVADAIRLPSCNPVSKPDGLTLIDTNLPCSGVAILAAATKAGAPIRYILLTPARADHTGPVDPITTKLGTVGVMESR